MKRARSILYLTVVLSIVCGLAVSRPGDAPSADTAATESLPEYREGVVVLRFAPGYMPNKASVDLRRGTFGIPALDAALAEHSPARLTRFLTEYQGAQSEGGKSLERTFVLYYDGSVDPSFLAAELQGLHYFDRVTVDRIIPTVYFGVAREVPGDNEFSNQWSLDYSRDSVDIDMPEAWAIEKGDPSVVVGILDSGTMMDTSSTNWGLHSDFSHHFTVEDNSPTGSISWADYDTTDAADPDSLPSDPYIGLDNVFGVNYSKRYKNETDDLVKSFWSNTPVNWLINYQQGWTVSAYITHGLNVAGIATAKADFSGGTPDNIAGIANKCGVYHVRRDRSLSIVEESHALISVSDFADVVNMSWGFCSEPLDDAFHDTVDYVAGDRDVVLVAAVGNVSTLQAECPNDPDDEVTAPARWTNVLGVSNMDSTLTLYDDSVYGPDSGFVAVTAPTGDGVPTTSHAQCDPTPPCDLDEETISFNGTSAASPHAAGIAALVRSRFPALDQLQVRRRVERAAEFYWSDTLENRKKYGSGKVNAYRALAEWGHVTADTAWGATTGMPDTLYVAGDLIIDSGVTLTLNKGTVVRVAGGDIEGDGTDTGKTEIVVKGDLKVGSAGSGPIVFESFVDGAQGDDDWIGIRFENATSSDSLAGVTVRNAKIGIQVDSGVMTLSDCTINDCQTGVKVLDAAVTVDTCTVRGASSYGLSVVSGDSTVTVKRSIFKDNDVGIYSADTTTTTIDGCTIDSCGVGIEAYRNNNVTITECTITNSTTDGVYAHTSSSIKIEGCTITDNATGVLAVDCHPRIWKSSAVKDNTTGIKCDDYADAVVESTTVTGNGVGIAAVNNSDPDLGHESGGSSSGYNIIHTSSSHHVANLTVGVNISAENNYWKGSETRWTTCQCEPKSSKISGAVDFCAALCSAPTLSSPYVGGPPGDDPELPTVYSLSQNYPNPFNPTTMLRYEVPAPGGLVRVNVYNVRGQLVRTLLDEHVAAGVHTLAWDGVNERGESVATGVYFVNMTAPGFTVTRKLVLVK